MAPRAGRSRESEGTGRGRVRSGRPESPAAALTDARDHGRVALAEALRALRCLLDAAVLAALPDEPRRPRTLDQLGSVLDAAADALEGEVGEGGARLVAAVAEALEAEIARWEERSREDGEARAVLRAFLGLRELLWELGIRPDDGGAGGRSSGHAASRDRKGSGSEKPDRGPRVERVPVEG